VIIIALLTNRKQENEEDKIAKNDVNEHDENYEMFDEELSYFKISIFSELIDGVEISVNHTIYNDYYVFPIGFQDYSETRRFFLEMIFTAEAIGFKGMEEDGVTLLFDFEDIDWISLENSKLELSFFGENQKLLLELPNKGYSAILYDAIDLGMKGYSEKEIRGRMFFGDYYVETLFNLYKGIHFSIAVKNYNTLNSDSIYWDSPSYIYNDFKSGGTFKLNNECILLVTQNTNPIPIYWENILLFKRSSKTLYIEQEDNGVDTSSPFEITLSKESYAILAHEYIRLKVNGYDSNETIRKIYYFSHNNGIK